MTQGFPGTKNAEKLVKRCTENIKIVCTHVTAVDAGSSFPSNHGKLFPQAFYARLGTELTNQSSQHQHSTQRGFPGTKNAGKLVKRCTENIKIVCTYVTAVDAGSSFPANHGKLFPRAFYARHGTERTSQSSQHQHTTHHRCEFPVFRSVDSLIYSIHQTKN